MAIHQLIPSFVAGDAMGQAALHFRALLRRMGHWGEIYAGEVERGFETLARPASALRPSEEDVVLYHHGIASPLAGALLHLPCRRGVVFHNITPSRFYAGTALAESLESGRAQLAALAGHVQWSLGVSALNAEELRLAGHADPAVVPLFVEPRRFAEDRADKRLLARLRGSGPVVLCVGRAVAHKRLEDVLSLHEELLRLEPNARTLFVGPAQGGSRYVRELLRRAKALGGVEFLGRVSHAELVAAYRAATLYVSMSEHEGFGVPLVEAMAADVPVLAYAAAAVPETLGGAGVCFTEKRFAFLAELARELSASTRLRERVLKGQRRRLLAFSDDASRAALSEVLGPSWVLNPSSGARKRTQKRRRPRVGILVQRYGEATGGAEAHARSVAERMAAYWDVTVWTTCATDHLSWANVLEPGESEEGPVTVRRFPVERAREMRGFNRLSRGAFAQANDRLHEERWLGEQGPYSPALLEALARECASYDGFVAFTALYLSTAWGLPLVGDRALLVPTAHDEPPMRFDLYDEVFRAPRALLCNTPEEQAFIRQRFPGAARSRVVGVGVDDVPGEPARFRERFGVRGRYLLYVGRIEPGKDVPRLLAYHAALRAAGGAQAPELLLAGALHMDVDGPGVRYLGRISDEEKRDGLAGAEAVVAPSRYESLSLLTLEAFAQGTPVIANGHSEVLAGQCRRSGAGVTYFDAAGFVTAVNEASAHRKAWGARGRAFAARHSWGKVIEVYREEMRRIVEAR